MCLCQCIGHDCTCVAAVWAVGALLASICHRPLEERAIRIRMPPAACLHVERFTAPQWLTLAQCQPVLLVLRSGV